METTAIKDTRITILLGLFDMQTPFFENALDGISDTDAHNRLDTKANHVAWLAGSLVEQRFELANMLGNSSLKQESHELFKHNKGIQDNVEYPALAEYLHEWKMITPVLRERLVSADADTLDKIIEFPEMSFPLIEMLSFAAYREANQIGQIALWRRLLGYGPMKYM